MSSFIWNNSNQNIKITPLFRDLHWLPVVAHMRFKMMDELNFINLNLNMHKEIQDRQHLMQFWNDNGNSMIWDL
jgi:hypothetical protein